MSREQNSQSLPPKKRVYTAATTQEKTTFETSIQGGKLITSPMVLSTPNGSTVYTGYQTPMQGMAYLPMSIQPGQQVQQYTTTQGAVPINQPINQVLKFQTVTKSPYTKTTVPQQAKIHMTTTNQPRTITTEQNARNKTLPPITYIQTTKVDTGEVKTEYKSGSIVMANTGMSGQVKVSSGIYRAVQSSHFSRPEITDPNATPERKVKTINRNAFKTEVTTASLVQTQHPNTSTPTRTSTGSDYKENYCQLYNNGISTSSSSLFMSESTEFFEKGSLITLENGDCKKIEDLSKDDFLKCGDISKDKRLITSILTEINHQRNGEQYVNLHFKVSETGQKVIVDAPLDYPYFTKFGWASIDPRLTEKRYKLNCRILNIDDEIFSIDKENSVKKVVEQNQNNTTQISVSHEMNAPNIAKLQHSSTSSAFRPIQNEKPTNGNDSVHRFSFDKSSISPRRRRRMSDSEVRL